MECHIAHMYGLLRSIPEADKPKDKELTEFWEKVAWEISQLLIYGQQAEKPQIVFKDFRKAGSQYLWEFWVNDLVTPKREAYNWHGQNTSQWLYAGAICLVNGRVSSHH